MTKRLGTLLLAASLAAAVAVACGPRGGEEHAARGVVVAVDAAQGEVTLDHGDIPGLMKGMTMTFEAEPALLAGVAAGDRVAFRVREAAPGRYVVTALEREE